MGLPATQAEKRPRRGRGCPPPIPPPPTFGQLDSYLWLSLRTYPSPIPGVNSLTNFKCLSSQSGTQTSQIFRGSLPQDPASVRLFAHSRSASPPPPPPPPPCFFFSPSRICNWVISCSRHVTFFFVAFFFVNSEMQAMFCGRILPSLYSFSCGSDFCKNRLLFAFKFTRPLRNVSIIDLLKMRRRPSKHSLSHMSHETYHDELRA